MRNSLEAGQGDNTCTKLRSRRLAAQATDRVAAEHDRHARTAEAEVARDRGREAVAARGTERGAEAPAEERERRRVRRDLRRVADGREALLRRLMPACICQASVIATVGERALGRG